MHVSVVDLFPPRHHDAPAELVGAVAESVGLDAPDPPGLPLFYRRGRWVDVPLAATYAAARAASPRRWRAVVDP